MRMASHASVLLVVTFSAVLCVAGQTPLQTPLPVREVAGGEPPLPLPSVNVRQVLDETLNLMRRTPKPSKQALAEQALPITERAVELARSIGDAAGEAYAQEERSSYLEELERNEEAAGASLAAAAIWEHLGETSEQVRNVLDAAHLMIDRRPAEADKLVEQALGLAKMDARRPRTCAQHLHAAGLGFPPGPQARLLLETALELREKLMPDTLDISETLCWLAHVVQSQGELGKAEELLLRALAIQERVAPESADTSSTLGSLGILRIIQDDSTRAREYLLRALAIEQKLRPGSPGSGSTLVNLGAVAWSEGDYVMAEQYARQVLELRAKRRPDAPPDPTALSNLGAIALRLGDWESAKNYFTRALEADEKIRPDSAGLPAALSGLGEVAYRQGEFPLAADHLQRSVSIYEKPEGDLLGLAETLSLLARVCQAQGDLDAAQKHLNRAKAIWEKMTPPVPWGMALLHEDMGWLARERRNWAEARTHFEQALALQEASVGPDHPWVSQTLRALATVETEAGSPEAGLAYALRAENTGREHLQLSARSLPERQALAYASGRSSGLDLILSLASGVLGWNVDVRRAAFDAFIRSRALVLDEMGARHHEVREATDPAVTRLSRELDAKRAQLAKLVVRGPGPDLSEAYAGPGQELRERYRTRLVQYRREKEDAERALAVKSANFREQQARSRIGLADVSAALPADSALLAFARFDFHELASPQPEARLAPPIPFYVAFVLRPGQEPAVVRLGPAVEVDALVARWREHMSRETVVLGRSTKQAEPSYRRAGDALRRKVWDPVVKRLLGAKRIFLVPDGPLSLVSFAALPGGTGRYLIETAPLIHYLSAERDLVPVDTRPSGGSLLALGAPAFDAPELFAALAPKEKQTMVEPAQVGATQTFRGDRSACKAFQSLRFKPLPASALESESVAAVWSKRNAAQQRLRGPSSGDPLDVLLLSGASASEEAFKRNAPGKQVLHLATHGFFLGGDCVSDIQASGKSRDEGRGAAAARENPMLLSGLAMAGANNRQAAGPEEEDGVLTAEEIAAMNLEGVEWAVLSACDTGIGEVKAGEGVFGLRRAFQVAGVRTLIMSLWPVEDKATQEWMNSLYRRRFLSGSGTAEAVRDASLELLRNRRARNQSTHPFYWAGFVAVGDWH